MLQLHNTDGTGFLTTECDWQVSSNLVAAIDAENVDMLRPALKAAEDLLTQNTSMASSFRLGKEISSVCAPFESCIQHLAAI